jgi:RNA polymerase sigma-70 factor (ECF subfamily)
MPERFDQLVLPHLDAAYNLARWLVSNPSDAEDIVQEAFLRALRFFGDFRGGDSRAWLLKIVRNTSYTWVRKNRPGQLADEFDETIHSDEQASENAEVKLLSSAESERVRKALKGFLSRSEKFWCCGKSKGFLTRKSQRSQARRWEP